MLSKFWLTSRVNSLKSVISANFRFKTVSFKALYQLFYSDKEAIDIEFSGALEWNELPDGKESYLTVTKEKTDFRNENDWNS